MNERGMETAASVLLALSLFAVSFASAAAFLTDRPPGLVNVITPGEVKVKLTEPDWEEEKGKDLLPGTIVPKNPTVENTGKTPAWMFLEVKVPVKNIRLVDGETGRKQEPGETELFAFAASSGWELIERTELPEKVTYIYGYKGLVKPKEKVQPLFENVTMAGYLEGEVTKEVLEIPVKAMAIQESVCKDETKLSEIYQIYLEQEGSDQER